MRTPAVIEDMADRPMRTAVHAADHVINLIALALAALLALYAGYQIWYTNSLLNGTFLSDDLAMYKPTGHEPTLSDLMALNSDVRAWLTINGTHIDYPVVQGRTDSDYLNRSIQGEFSLSGSIFLSAANSPGFTDPYNMVYGHHVEGGAMFSDVLEFRSKEYFDAHPTGILWVGESAMRVDLFAAVEIDALDKVIYQDSGSVTADALPFVVDYIRAHAAQQRDIPIGAGDSIIAMSTCQDATSFARVVLFGKLVPMTPEEIAAAEAANAKQAQDEGVLGANGVAPAIMDRYPWLLPAGGGLAFVVLIILLRSIASRRAERRRLRQARRRG